MALHLCNAAFLRFDNETLCCICATPFQIHRQNTLNITAKNEGDRKGEVGVASWDRSCILK